MDFDYFDYTDIFCKLKKDLEEKHIETDTKKLTQKIKEFFSNRFKDNENYKVFYSRNPRDFLYDVSVINCNPKEILLDNKTDSKIILSVESELGGSGASKTKCLLENLGEDFFKILNSSADYRIFYRN